jgi:cytochrome P450
MDPIFLASAFSCQTAYPVLESVINETLRLYPPVLFGSQRVTPPEGLNIGNVYIPGDMVVYMPTWQLHHDARNFVRPDEFIPERWMEKSEMVLNRSAFLPFLIGMCTVPDLQTMLKMMVV